MLFLSGMRGYKKYAILTNLVILCQFLGNGEIIWSLILFLKWMKKGKASFGILVLKSSVGTNGSSWKMKSKNSFEGMGQGDFLVIIYNCTLMYQVSCSCCFLFYAFKLFLVVVLVDMSVAACLSSSFQCSVFFKCFIRYLNS